VSRFIDHIEPGNVALGMHLTYPTPTSIEVIAKGWDWLWVDAQHGQLDDAAVVHAVQVAELINVPAVVRVPGHEASVIGRALDAAPSGLLVPLVNSRAAAEAVVRAAYFPPLGERSYGGRRVIDSIGPDYHLKVNKSLVLLAQVETPEAVRNAEDIASVEGVTGLFFGAQDLKIRLGLPVNLPNFDSPELMQAMRTIAEAAQRQGKVAACVANGNDAAIQEAAGMGYSLIVGGSDIMFLRNGSRNRLEQLRNTLNLSSAPVLSS